MTYCETCTNDFSLDDFDGCPHCDIAEGRSPVRAARRSEAPLDAEPLYMTGPASPPEGGALRDVLQSIRRMAAAPAPRPQAPEGLADSLRALVDQKIEAQVGAPVEPEATAAPVVEPVIEAELPPELSPPEPEGGDAVEAAPVLAEVEPPAKGSIGGHQARELDVETLRKIRESGVFTMVLLGLPTAGKTWFLNRLKYELQEGDAYACYPRRAPPGEVENTLLFTAHRFRKGAHDFYMIDIPGERFQKAVEGSFLGESNTLMRHVIFSGHAFLTLLPADETLLSERAYDLMWRQKNGQAAAHGVDLDSLPAPQILIDRVDALKKLIVQARKVAAEKGDPKSAGRLKALLQERKRLLDGGVQQAVERLAAKNEELGEYISGIGLMAQLMVVMNEKGTPDLDPSIDAYEVFDASRAAERKKPTQPMFVVLSKSDDLTHRSDAVQLPIRRLVQGDGRAAAELRTLLNDPHRADAFAALSALRPGVARQIDEWFAWTSFQFATAFNGVSRGSKEINYQLRHVGVTELIRAILRLKEHTEKRRPWEAIAGLFRRRAPEETERAA
jgi:hypothetical protein